MQANLTKLGQPLKQNGSKLNYMCITFYGFWAKKDLRNYFMLHQASIFADIKVSLCFK